MPEERTTPDHVERARQFREALDRGDVDAIMSFFAPDAVWDASPTGMTTIDGAAAIRRMIVAFLRPYEAVETKEEERRDFGNGSTFSVLLQKGRTDGGRSFVQTRQGFVIVSSADGLIERVTTYLDIDEARAAAQGLAKERG